MADPVTSFVLQLPQRSGDLISMAWSAHAKADTFSAAASRHPTLFDGFQFGIYRYNGTSYLVILRCKSEAEARAQAHRILYFICTEALDPAMLKQEYLAVQKELLDLLQIQGTPPSPGVIGGNYFVNPDGIPMVQRDMVPLLGNSSGVGIFLYWGKGSLESIYFPEALPPPNTMAPPTYVSMIEGKRELRQYPYQSKMVNGTLIIPVFTYGY